MMTRHGFATSGFALLLAPVVLFAAGMLLPVALLLVLLLPILAIAGLVALLVWIARLPERPDDHPRAQAPFTGLYTA